MWEPTTDEWKCRDHNGAPGPVLAGQQECRNLAGRGPMELGQLSPLATGTANRASMTPASPHPMLLMLCYGPHWHWHQDTGMSPVSPLHPCHHFPHFPIHPPAALHQVAPSFMAGLWDSAGAGLALRTGVITHGPPCHHPFLPEFHTPVQGGTNSTMVCCQKLLLGRCFWLGGRQ